MIADIGIPLPLIDELEGPHLELLTRERMRELVPSPRRRFAQGRLRARPRHRRVDRRTGAAHLAALGALRSGAGLVTIATPRSCVPILAAMAPEYMTEPLDETAAGPIDFGAVERVLELKADVIARWAGPRPVTWDGGVRPGASSSARGVPLVLDADALNAFAEDPERLIGRDGVEVIITPHPGEMARLLNISGRSRAADRLEHVRVTSRPRTACTSS